MNVLDLLRKESDSSAITLVIMGVISGVSNAFLLVIVNKASEHADDDNTLLFIASIISVSLFLVTQRYVLRESTQQVQDILERIRVRIINKIRNGELQMVEELGDSEVYARITNDTQDIASASFVVARAFQAAILVIFSFVYIAMMSIPALFIILAVIVLGTISFFRSSKRSDSIFRAASKKDTAFFHALSGILSGFKELKVNKRKNEDAFQDYSDVARAVNRLRVKARFANITSQLVTESLFYVMLISVIFIIPVLSQTANPNIVKISAAILFIIGPITAVIGAVPALLEANHAAYNIHNLEKKIENELNSDEQETEEDRPKTPLKPFDLEKEIRLENLQFEYPRRYESDGFHIGPISLIIPKGQLTFITGGNGSGKSTLLKLICGLYYPESGKLQVDGQNVTRDNYQRYREMLSIIFTDFHLFDRLFGLREIDQERVNELLRKMQISEKTQIIEDRITDLNLSTGQRKRLSLVIAILEDRPVYVFDEVAADQDPGFKKYFYTELLPEMKKLGKTLIVVTHDDQYFDVADSWYKLLDGKLISTDSNGDHV
ncbi:MAG: cyclic peptide export ABC transporter [Cytophagales bacterium]|nr:cyclic peptide export ABC transporter [Cytophagales bacterium]